MLRFLVLLMLLVGVCFASDEGNDYTFPSTYLWSVGAGSIAAQNVGVSWAAVSGNTDAAIEVTGYKKVIFPISIEINDSSNLRFRVLWGASESASSLYRLPIQTVGATSVAIAPEYKEYSTDEDGLSLLEFDIPPINWIVLQAQVSAQGTTSAQLIDVKHMLVK